MGKRRTYTPLIFGILFVALAIFGEDIAYATEYSLSFEENILLNFVVRGAAVFIAYTYCDRFQIKKTWWVLFSIIFGGWTLIVLNFAIWMYGNEKEELDEESTNKPEDSNNIE